MSFLLSASGEYDRSYFVKSVDLTLLQKILVRLSSPFYLPALLLRTLFTKADDNIITKKKSKMTGVMNCAVSK